MTTVRLLLTSNSILPHLGNFAVNIFPTAFPHLKQLESNMQCYLPSKTLLKVSGNMHSHENGTSNTFSCRNLLEVVRDVKSQILCCTDTFCTVRIMGPQCDGSSHHAVYSIVGKSLPQVAAAAGSRQNTEDRR